MQTYEYLTKNIHRSCVVEMYLTLPDRPIVYLDDHNAGATRYFLSRNVPPEHLVPVNLRSDAIDSIRDLTGVCGVADDIDSFVATASHDAYSVVWLDYVRRTCPTDVMKNALRAAPYVCVTLSLRATTTDDVEDLKARARRVARVLECPHPYKGKSGVCNMLKFSLARLCDRESAEEKDVEKEVTEPVTPQVSEGDKVFVHWRRRNWLTAVVVENVSREALRVRFDCDGVIAKVPRAQTLKNTTRTLMDDYLGSSVGIPIKLWDARGRKDLTETKKIGRRAIFKLGRKFRGDNERLTLNAVLKDGTLCRRDEPFLITPEQAMCWLL